MPIIPDRDLQAEQDHAEWLGWAEAQDYDATESYTLDQVQEAFTEALKIQRSACTAPVWEVIGHDTFSGDDYPLGDPIGTRAVFPNRDLALECARRHLDGLERTQPTSSSGGQGFGGIQDRVFILHPGGRRESVLSAMDEATTGERWEEAREWMTEAVREAAPRYPDIPTTHLDAMAAAAYGYSVTPLYPSTDRDAILDGMLRGWQTRSE
jgi:hypothetical protein